MDKLEKVIKGLECCQMKPLVKCEACPYADADEGTCFTMDKMHRDALALLKALDVTPEELERLKMCRAECKIDCLLEHYDKVKDELDAMKKAQGPVKPTWKNGYPLCGECGFKLHWIIEQNNYCPNCGRAVKWE